MVPVDEAEFLVVRRVIRVPRERVFAAWLNPVGMSRWMCPGPMERATVELDARVGGAFYIDMEHGGAHHEHRGVYLAIERPALLSFTWISDSTFQRTTVVTVEFLEREGGAATEVVLTHRGLPDDRREAHRQGWTDILRKLADIQGPGVEPTADGG